jgi:excisionase family DNA binding protein
MKVIEAAAALGVKRSAVRKAIARGTLPATKTTGPLGAEYDIEPAAVEAYRLRDGRKGKVRG